MTICWLFLFIWFILKYFRNTGATTFLEQTSNTKRKANVLFVSNDKCSENEDFSDLTTSQVCIPISFKMNLI